jgi:hypothetical protein
MVLVDFFAFGLCMRRIWSIRQSCVSPVVLSHLADARGGSMLFRFLDFALSLYWNVMPASSVCHTFVPTNKSRAAFRTLD